MKKEEWEIWLEGYNEGFLIGMLYILNGMFEELEKKK